MTEQRQSVTEARQSVTERRQGVTEQRQSAIERRQSATEQRRGMTEQRQSVTERRREELDFRQNVTIALLAVLAVFLFSRTELFYLGWETFGAGLFSVSKPTASARQENANPGLSLPLRFAVTGMDGGVYGRYVAVNMNSQERSLRDVRRLFADALTVPLPFEETGQDAFLSALRGTSIYCDFMTSLPLSLLAGLADAELSDERPVRALALARTPKGVKLYLWDGAETCCRRDASVSVRELQDVVEQYELSGGAFASDLSGADSAWRNVAPLSLFPESVPSLPVYSAFSGLPDTDMFLTAFRFNPLTKSRYTEANGTEVIMEGGRSVRIRANGNVYYQDGGGAGGLQIQSAGEIPTAWEAAKECAAMLNDILASQGCATVYPLEIRRQDSVTVLRFGCARENLPVLYADGGAAAVVTLDGRKITSAELRPRRYSVTDAESLLLPVRQALGLAAAFPGAELRLGYQDTGGARLYAQWFSLNIPTEAALWNGDSSNA